MDRAPRTLSGGRGGTAMGGGTGSRKVRAGHRSLTITDPGRVIFPEIGATKGDLVEYYRRIGREILPHIRGRPLVGESFPDGVDREGVRWAAPPGGLPDWIERRQVAGEAGGGQVVCNRTPDLLYLVEQGMVTPYVSPAHTRRPRHPDRMVLDVNPQDATDFDAVREAAETLRVVLQRLNLASFPMTTGLRGVHVVVPLTGRDDFAEVRRFAQSVVEMAVADAPGKVRPAAESGPSAPAGGATVALAAAAPGQVSVAPYAVRGQSHGPVATPFAWDDLARVEPGRHTVANMFRHLAAGAEPWREMKRFARSLSRARRPL